MRHGGSEVEGYVSGRGSSDLGGDYETGGEQYQGFEIKNDTGLNVSGEAIHDYEVGGDQREALSDNKTSSGNETPTPRDRARDGIRRRGWPIAQV